jgi:hypothetical protein
MERVQYLRTEAQHLWRQTLTDRQEQIGDPQHFAELMLQHQRLLLALRHALIESTSGTQE